MRDRVQEPGRPRVVATPDRHGLGVVVKHDLLEEQLLVGVVPQCPEPEMSFSPGAQLAVTCSTMYAPFSAPPPGTETEFERGWIPSLISSALTDAVLRSQAFTFMIDDVARVDRVLPGQRHAAESAANRATMLSTRAGLNRRERWFRLPWSLLSSFSSQWLQDRAECRSRPGLRIQLAPTAVWASPQG